MARPWLTAFFCVAGAAGVFACASSETTDDGDESALEHGTEASLYRPGNRFAGWGGSGDVYLDEVQPLLGKRCVTCHGCSSSPCQLKLSSFEGVHRGSNAHSFFDTNEGNPTRLKDGKTDADWRRKGFYSVVSGGDTSIMFKLLSHGTQHNATDFDLAPAYALYKQRAELLAFACVDQPGELDERLSQPGTGMPLGLPGLPPEESAVILDWLKTGAKGPSDEAQRTLETARDPAAVASWEALFNRSDAKSRLASRYIYEHAFFGKLHIDDSTKGRGDFFELVRSSTATGPIRELVTETPNQDPGAPFFYRLKKYTPLIVAKDHIVFHLDANVMARWKTLLYESDWTTDRLDDFSKSNPFEAFAAIPGTLRSQFMIENAHKLIDAMVKGDVCTGSTATSAIRDRFATLFLQPASDPSALDPKLGQTTYAHLDPSDPSPVRDAKLEKLFAEKLKAFKPNGLDENDVWDGARSDKNAWVTVMRHETNSSAHQGPVGQQPDSMWILDYVDFERLYYALVALYKPWGSGKLKSDSWMTMAQVRSHSEDLFLMLLPEQQRDAVRKQITPGFTDLDATPMRGVGYPTAMRDVSADHPVEHVVSRLRTKLGAAIAPADALEPDPLRAATEGRVDTPTAITARLDADRALLALAKESGKLASVLPEVTWLTVTLGRDEVHYTMIANRIFGGPTRTVQAPQTRHPELESLAITKGHIGNFPQLFLRVPASELGRFVDVARGTSDADRARLRSQYEIRRNTPAFWSTLEAEHERALREQPLESGIIDTSAYVWPEALQPAPR